MSLSALTDLFARHRARATGLWRLGQDPHRTIFMETGDIVFATSTHPFGPPHHLLVERGRITQAQLDCHGEPQSDHVHWKNLIEMGFITQRDLLVSPGPGGAGGLGKAWPTPRKTRLRSQGSRRHHGPAALRYPGMLLRVSST